ncbi:MAG: PQQ-dependent sugar dehydrogenase [Chloroflexi bacterium]|nr:PQQ-dependent sugar dehydrogenase [Chloroflexota bacterium]
MFKSKLVVPASWLTALLIGCLPVSGRSSEQAATSAAPATRQGRPPVVAPTTFVDGVLLPVGLTFAPDGRLFFVEVNKGAIRVVENGALRPRPFATLEVAKGTEHGALGLALDPDFTRNHYVYLYYTVPKKSGKPDANRVVRFTDVNSEGQDVRTVFDNIPVDVKGAHNGGRMAFGPDGKLYVSTGAPGDEGNDAQQLNVLEGKILRLNPDGSVPSDNPFPGSPVFALGFRNPFGMAFHPTTGELYVVDNGPRGYDELDLVQAGGNYGAPLVAGDAHDPRFVDPLWNSGEERLGVAGLTFYTGNKLPEYQGDAFLCFWNPGLLHRVRLSGPDFRQVAEAEDLSVDCRVDVATGPDGALYVASIASIQRLSR